MIDFQNVSVTIQQQRILSNISLHIGPGEFISLVGESGVGKTTLLRLIYFDLFPDEGEVCVGEYQSSAIRKKEIAAVRRCLGIVFQDYKLLEEKTVFENVAFALEVTAVPAAEIAARTLKVLAEVSLSHKRDNKPSELSGGEQQRVVIARALVNRPQALLADEPTGNLDPATSMDILQLLREINQRGTAVIVATHNYEFVRRSGSRILQLRDGELTEIPTI
jgi:cell division transport system ATP-binding protein